MKSKNIRRLHAFVLCRTIGSLSLLALALFAMPLQAAQPKVSGQASNAPEWVYPAVPGFGGVHPRPNLPVRPDPRENYKIFVDVISADRDPSGQFNSLQRLARLVNLMAYAKVPPGHVHIVALLDEDVGAAAGTNVFYRKTFKADNPNLDLIHALKKAGVEMLVCSQALAGQHIPDSAIDPAVTITLSALTDMAVYGHEGYTYMRL
ncbi:MAG: DsrE family protein [Gammaproteobacteria bacterium]